MHSRPSSPFSQAISASIKLSVPCGFEGAHDLQTSGLDNALELVGRSLSRRQAEHELPVETGRHPMRTLAREDELVDEDFRVAPCHRWHELLEDVAASGVTPVMHDGMEKICPLP